MLKEDLEKLQGIPFSRTLAVQILQENPFIKITHHTAEIKEYCKTLLEKNAFQRYIVLQLVFFYRTILRR